MDDPVMKIPLGQVAVSADPKSKLKPSQSRAKHTKANAETDTSHRPHIRVDLFEKPGDIERFA